MSNKTKLIEQGYEPKGRGSWRALAPLLRPHYGQLLAEGEALGLDEEDAIGICTVAAQAVFDARGRYPWVKLGERAGLVNIGELHADLVREAYHYLLTAVVPDEYEPIINAVYLATSAVFRQHRGMVPVRSRLLEDGTREYYLVDTGPMRKRPLSEAYWLADPKSAPAIERIDEAVSAQQDVAVYRRLVGDHLWSYVVAYAEEGSAEAAGKRLGCSDQTVLNRLNAVRAIVARYEQRLAAGFGLPYTHGSEATIEEMQSSPPPTGPGSRVAACPDCGNLISHPACPSPRSGPTEAPERRCGTISGYEGHRSRGETPCDECREAKRTYSARWRARRRKQK